MFEIRCQLKFEDVTPYELLSTLQLLLNSAKLREKHFPKLLTNSIFFSNQLIIF